MHTLTLKNIPSDLYQQLKQVAKTHRRSLNSEILYCVERALNPNKIDLSEHITIARALRAKTATHAITNDEINAAKNEGRL